jgi:hypothetical protein
MPEKKIESIKIYIAIGLALVLVIVGYFRLVRKPPANATVESPSVTVSVQSDVNSVLRKSPRSDSWRKAPAAESLRPIVRDIFIPLKPLKKAETDTTEQKPSRPGQSLKLRGTIVGGESPIAIINDRFVRAGDSIGDYTVVRIGKKEVVLDAGNREMALEMGKDD